MKVEPETFSYLQELKGVQVVLSRGKALDTQRTKRLVVEAAMFFFTLPACHCACARRVRLFFEFYRHKMAVPARVLKSNLLKIRDEVKNVVT